MTIGICIQVCLNLGACVVSNAQIRENTGTSDVPTFRANRERGCFDVLFAIIVAFLFLLCLQFTRDCDSVSLLLLGTVIALLVLY